MKVTSTCIISEEGIPLHGILMMTTFRLIFSPFKKISSSRIKFQEEYFHIPLGLILK